MGLFSKQVVAPKSPIPQDILDEVSVNGKKKPTVQDFAPLESVASEAPKTVSPFLAEAPAATKTLQDETPVESVSTEEAPKDFQFSNESPTAGAIHFTGESVPETKSGENNEKKVPDFSQITTDPALEQAKASFEPTSKEKTSGWNKMSIFPVLVFILILGLISGGAWYYFNTRSAVTDTATDSIEELDTTIANSAATLPEDELDSLTVGQPNYLKLDVESATLESIREMLTKEAQKIQKEGITTPVEYLITDLNENPVAFARFALLVKAGLPNVLVNASSEPFSVYLQQQGGTPHLAIAVKVRPGTQAELQEKVPGIAISLANFLFTPEEASKLPEPLIFKDGDYNGQKIYYYNLENTTGGSFDITFEPEAVIVGNNKDITRAVFDQRRE